MTAIIKSLAVSLLILSGLSSYAQGQKDKIQQVEQNLIPNIAINGAPAFNLKDRMEFYHIPGLSIAVISNYKIAWAKGYGVADDSLKTPVTDRTLFQAGSISKTLNAMAALKLAQDDRLNLNADINNYLTSWKFPYDSVSKGKKITMLNLLTHTAGINIHGFLGYKAGAPIPNIQQMLKGENPANSARIRSLFEPGKTFQYSGGGVLVSQMCIMDITGKPYTAFLTNSVLHPLGMSNSTYEQTGEYPFASGHHIDGSQLQGQYNRYPELAAAGLWTTPADLAKMIIEIQLAYKGRSAKVLNRFYTRMQLTPYLSNAGPGVFIDSADNTKYFQHGGATIGFQSQYYGSFDGGNGVVIMANSDHNEIISEIVNSVARVYGFKGLSQSVIKNVVTLSDAELQSYAGNYQVGPNFSLTIEKKDNQLYARIPGRPMVKLFPESSAIFFIMEAPIAFEFVKSANGAVTGVILNEKGHKTEAKRITP